MIIFLLTTIAVSEVSANSDTVAATFGQVIMHDSNNETELTSCQLESERPLVKTKGGLRDFKTVAQFCDTFGYGEPFDVDLFSREGPAKAIIKLYDEN
jgi:hypothetical protein